MYMDFIKFYIIIILLISYFIGNLIIYFSRDEIKNSKKALIHIKLIIHMILLIILLFLSFPFSFYKIILILIGIIISYFYFNPLILSISVLGIALSSKISLFFISLLLIYLLISGISNFTTNKYYFNNKINIIILIFIILISFFIKNNTSLIPSFTFGYLINIKILNYKNKTFINT